MLPIKFLNQIAPHENKHVIPISRVRVAHSPLTVKSTGLAQTRYRITNTSVPDFSGLANLEKLDSGITPLVGFYSATGAPIGLNVIDNFAIRYTGRFFNLDYGNNSHPFNFKVIGFGKFRMQIGSTWLYGGASTYIDLDQHTYNESSSINLDFPGIITVDYYTQLGEAGFVLLWKSDYDENYVPVSAGVTFPDTTLQASMNDYLIPTATLSNVFNPSSIKSSGDISSFGFDIPLVESSNSVNGYYYDRDFDKYIDVLDSTKYLRKYSMVEYEVGYKQDNKMVFFDSTKNQHALITDANQTGLDLGTSDFMIEAWIKHPDVGGAARLLTWKYDGTNGYDFGLASDGTVAGRLADGTLAVHWGTTEVDDDKVHHIVYVVDKSETDGGKIFIDGVEESTYTLQNDVSGTGSIDSTKDFFLGHDDIGSYFNGKIDEVRVWDFGINGLPTEYAQIIKDHYNFPHRISTFADTSELKLRLTMQETSDSPATLTDISGNSNNLTTVNSPDLIWQEVGADFPRSQRTSDSNYETYINKFIGHINKFELTRKNSGVNSIRVSCVGFESLLKNTLNFNYPDKFDYWVEEFGGLDFNDLRPDGVDFPLTYDAWPLDKAVKSLMVRGHIDPNLFHKRNLFLNNAGSQVSGSFLIEQSNPQVVLERARNYGTPDRVFAFQEPDDEYRLQSNFGDTLFDYINTMVEPYGWQWGMHSYYAGAPYLRSLNNPTTIVPSENLTLSGGGWSGKNANLGVISGTYQETSAANDYAEHTFTGERLDLVSVLYGGNIGGTQATDKGGSISTVLSGTDVKGNNFAVGNRVIVHLPTGSESKLLDGVVIDGNDVTLTLDSALSIVPVSGTLIRTAVASAEVKRGSNWSTAESVSTAYIPSYYEHGLEFVSKIAHTKKIGRPFITSGTKRFFYHGIDDKSVDNPTIFNIATGLTRDTHMVRITRLSNTEAQSNALLGVNALYVHDKDRNLPVYTFRTGDAVASGTLIDLSVKNSGEDIRNDVTVVGRRVAAVVPGGFEQTPLNPNNPSYEFIISRAVDVNSINNPNALNFIGHPSQTILIEPSIGSQDRADYWAVAFLNRFRFPGQNSTFQALGHPLMEEGDCIYVDDEHKSSVDTSNKMWIEEITSTWKQKSALDKYETSNFQPWESFVPKVPVSISDFDNKAVTNIQVTNGGTTGSPYDPYTSDSAGTFIEVSFDMVVSGFLKVEVWATHNEFAAKVADLLNITGDEGQKGWIRETFGTNKKVVWDGVDQFGDWNERWLEVSDEVDQGFTDWFASEPKDADGNLDDFAKFYLVFKVIDFSGTQYILNTGSLVDVNPQIFLYTKRGDAIAATLIASPAFVKGTFTVKPTGFFNTDNANKGLKLTFNRTNGTIRPVRLLLEILHRPFGAQMDFVPSPGPNSFTVGAEDKDVIVEREEFIDYTNKDQYFHPLNDLGIDFNDWAGHFGTEQDREFAFIGHYVTFALWLTDKSGRTVKLRTAHFWDNVYPETPVLKSYGRLNNEEYFVDGDEDTGENLGYPWGVRIK